MIRAAHRQSTVAFRGRAGFTLVEVLIVIGIILLLVAITVGVAVGLSERTEIRQTQSTMAILTAAVDEWRLQSARTLTYGKEGEPCDNNERYEIEQLTGAGDVATFEDALRTTDIFFAVLSRNDTFREFIARIDPQFVVRLDVGDPPTGDDPLDGELDHLEDADFTESFRILDAWGRPMLVILPGRTFRDRPCPGESESPDVSDGLDKDEDGTIRTPKENVFGVARNRRLFFVSAGPDEFFGDLFLFRSPSEMSSLDDDDQRDFNRSQDNIYSERIQIDEARP